MRFLYLTAACLLLTSCQGWEKHKENRTNIMLDKLTTKADTGNVMASAENVEAQYDLGMMYAIGYNKAYYQVPQDYNLAAKWLSKASEYHHPKAQFKLSELYLYGLGVPQDPKHGLQLLNLSAQNGYPLAVQMYEDTKKSGMVELINTNPERAKKLLTLQKLKQDILIMSTEDTLKTKPLLDRYKVLLDEYNKLPN